MLKCAAQQRPKRDIEIGERMTKAATDRVAELTADENRFVFDSFDPAAAWRLGTLMVERALREHAAVIIDIRRPGLVLFRSALAGTTAENEAWLERKARTVLRHETSTALLSARFEAQGVDPWSTKWFDSEQFAAAGGSFPVRVPGVGVVAAITVSGLTSDEDHEFVVQSLTQYIALSTTPS
jgi:uncharacterized protein (UPF0303 family)